MMIEAIHSETYSVLIDTYISNTDEKNVLFKAIENIPAVKKKADWAIKWIEEGSTLQQMIPEKYMESYEFLQNKDADSPLHETHIEALNFLTKERPSFAQRLLAYVCVEGIFFSGSFCAIYWLKNRGLMPGLSTANQFISRDENLHGEFAVCLYKMLENRLSEETVHDIFKEAVEIEKEFITESLPVSLIGMNCNLMKQYIEYVADRWLVLLGYSKIYNTQNPFGFMELISVNEKVSFFECVNSNYTKSNVGASEEDRKISFDSDDF
jgi:ribonucleoside-diphosphate reductase beta chain